MMCGLLVKLRVAGFCAGRLKRRPSPRRAVGSRLLWLENVPQEPSGHQGRVGSVDDSASAIAWRLSRPGCPIFSLPLDADAFGVEKTGFARKLAARPQGAGEAVRWGEVCGSLFSGSGGLGLRQGDGGASVAQRFMPRHGHAGRCPDPPRNLRFLGFSVCCRAFGAWHREKSQAQAATIAARSRQAEPASIRNVPQEPSGHQGRVGSVDFAR